MENRKSKRVMFSVFIFAVFIILMIYVGLKGYDIYRSSREFVNKTTEPSIDCIGYVYDINDLSYEDGSLRFQLINRDYSDYEIKNINIISEEGNNSIELERFRPGSEQYIEIKINISEVFSIYPDNCMVYKKEFVIEDE